MNVNWRKRTVLGTSNLIVIQNLLPLVILIFFLNEVKTEMRMIVRQPALN